MEPIIDAEFLKACAVITAVLTARTLIKFYRVIYRKRSALTAELQAKIESLETDIEDIHLRLEVLEETIKNM
jgi:uncharacterized protein YqiB (DUF1249 family)